MTRKNGLKEFLSKIREERLRRYKVEATLVGVIGMSSAGKSRQVYHAKAFINSHSEFSFIPVDDIRESEKIEGSDLLARAEYRKRMREGLEEDLDDTLDVLTKYREIAWRDRIIPEYCRYKGVIFLQRDADDTLILQSILRGYNGPDDPRALRLAKRIYEPEHIIPPHISLVFISNVKIVLEKERREAEVNRREQSDKYYIQAYKMMHNGKEASPEVMRKWWLATTRKGYIDFRRKLPDESYIITIGKDFERLNPITRRVTYNLCDRLKDTFK